MSWDSWTCLTVEKGPGVISDDVRNVLKAAACNLRLQGVDRMMITHDICDGIIQTDWDTHSVGGRTGVLFRCQVIRDDGDYFVNFLLHERDLEAGMETLRRMEADEEGAWEVSFEDFPLEALYKFNDLRRSKMH